MAMRGVHIDSSGPYQAGDPSPEGYLQWQEWAATQYKAGLRQRRCAGCDLWKFPQELNDAGRCATCQGQIDAALRGEG